MVLFCGVQTASGLPYPPCLGSIKTFKACLCPCFPVPGSLGTESPQLLPGEPLALQWAFHSWDDSWAFLATSPPAAGGHALPPRGPRVPRLSRPGCDCCHAETSCTCKSPPVFAPPFPIVLPNFPRVPLCGPTCSLGWGRNLASQNGFKVQTPVIFWWKDAKLLTPPQSARADTLDPLGRCPGYPTGTLDHPSKSVGSCNPPLRCPTCDPCGSCHQLVCYPSCHVTNARGGKDASQFEVSRVVPTPGRCLSRRAPHPASLQPFPAPDPLPPHRRVLFFFPAAGRQCIFGFRGCGK